VKKLLVIIIITGIYLNRSYAYFYNFLDQHHLTAPAHETKLTIGNHPDSQTIKYVALGDSLTEGVGTSDYKNSYPYLLTQTLSTQENIELSNFAHAGDTSADLLINQVPKALAVKPVLVTLLIGINDVHNLKSAAEFENNYIKIVTTLQKSGAKVYTLSIPYLGSPKIVYFPYNFLLDFRTKQFNAIIKKVSLDLGAEYTDVYTSKKPTGFYSTDEFHPTDQGYKEWIKQFNVN